MSWFRAMWHMTSQKYGANALGLNRTLNLGSYETAWQWLHKLRRAMVRPGRDQLAGPVQVDEIYVGGRKKPGKRGRGAAGKALVAIAVEDKGRRSWAASAYRAFRMHDQLLAGEERPATRRCIRPIKDNQWYFSMKVLAGGADLHRKWHARFR